MKAIERQTYIEGGGDAALPHPPASLRDDAIPLARQLTAAGFATPSIDALIAEPASLRFHSIREILDELDVIAG
jgi:predicted naringenin-chalcone synthase